MKTVLVVDDEPKIVDVVREYLEHAGFSVRTAGDGPAALERARALAPDLIVLDLGLPGLDGVHLATEERRSEAAAVAVDADAVRLQQILGNLLSNAVRHTPGGGTVTIAVDRPEPGWVRVSVDDTPPGTEASTNTLRVHRLGQR